MVFLILIKLNANMDFIKHLDFGFMNGLFTAEAMIETAKSINKVDVFTTIFLSMMIIWMSRRFLASILDGMQNIFHVQQGRKDSIAFILAFIIALIIVISITSILFAFATLETFVELKTFAEYPQVQTVLEYIYSAKFTQFLPYVLLQIVITIIYKIGPGTKPPVTLSFCSALLCTVTFWVFITVLHLFLDVNSYGAIYSGMGNIIITLMDVFFFFVFFMFFAQFIFTYQFFDDLLIGELYLLPKRESKGFWTAVRRALFIRPDFLMAKEPSFYFKKDEKIYKMNDVSHFAYFIAKGKVVLKNKDNTETVYGRGDFFGEVGCIIGKARDSDAITITDCEIVKIDGRKFQFLVKHNQDASHKALGQISDYLTGFFGRTEDFYL